ncbi:MAG: SET domain-containing protein [Cyanobacteriota bacterium]|nr:SET domain-containing protein [Cyanobacteriota bacterium]
MGLQVPHFTAPSPIHGTGLYSRDALAEGAILWVFEPGLDWRVALQALQPEQRTQLLHHGYINPLRLDEVVICGDLARFWNFPHPGEPANSHPTDDLVEGEAVIVASRAIAAGEELLIHPNSDADYPRKIGGRPHPSLVVPRQRLEDQPGH